jgi:hypothetical protein
MSAAVADGPGQAVVLPVCPGDHGGAVLSATTRNDPRTIPSGPYRL